MSFSIVVPVGKNDEAWRELLQDFGALNSSDEVIFVSHTTARLKEAKVLATLYKLKCQIRWLRSKEGRGRQMNFGANNANNDFIWFLHCDSRIEKSALLKLKSTAQKNPKTIYFFRLIFNSDGPWLMKITNIGVRIRSELLGLPFGDQGFCMHQNIFKKIGKFSEHAPYGEDHLFIWSAYQNNIKVVALSAPIYTSARRYRLHGWLSTTLKHLYLTYKQAGPEFLKLYSLIPAKKVL